MTVSFSQIFPKMCTGADTCSGVCLLPDFSRVGLSSLPIPAGSRAAAVPAVPGQGGRERWQHCSVCTGSDDSCRCVTAAHREGNEPEDLSSLDEFICSHFLAGNVQVRTYVFRSRSH